MKTQIRTGLLAAAVAAMPMVLAAGAAQASEVIGGSCDSVTDGDAQGCLFSGNINGNTDPTNVNSHKNAEQKYNAWANSFNPDLENITLNYLTGTDDSNFSDFGTWTGLDTPSGMFDLNGLLVPPGFQLEYFAVKAGNQFTLYEFTGTGLSGSWSTAGMSVGRSPNLPGVSHLAFFGSGGSSAVPEPATWAFMIVGFGAVGHSLRSARRQKAKLAAA